MFQSTHPRRVRLNVENYVNGLGMFQSTHPRRVRRLPPRFCLGSLFCFNPRTHVGCDDDVVDSKDAIDMFQSTHPRRVRQELEDEVLKCINVSIHAPT